MLPGMATLAQKIEAEKRMRNEIDQGIAGDQDSAMRHKFLP